ncbi:hypothetical protein CHU98_g9052 [Xylaria longipes]|nr:hypothetical protein CHU98_g9052 [Xylaria longipes]
MRLNCLLSGHSSNSPRTGRTVIRDPLRGPRVKTGRLQGVEVKCTPSNLTEVKRVPLGTEVNWNRSWARVYITTSSPVIDVNKSSLMVTVTGLRRPLKGIEVKCTPSRPTEVKPTPLGGEAKSNLLPGIEAFITAPS